MRLAFVSTILAGVVLGVVGCHSPESRGAAQESAAQGSASAQQIAAEAPVGAPARVDAKDSRPVIVCFGDSLTAGFGTDPGQAYPDDLQADLDKLGYHYRVVNLGVSGNTTKDGVARLPDVLALHPAVAVVEFGGNDGLRGLPLADTRASLDQIVGTLQRAGIKVALAGITLPPDYGPDYIRQFDGIYTEIAKKYHVPMLPFLLEHVYGVPGMMQADETHATAKGNQVVARNVLGVIRPLLHR